MKKNIRFQNMRAIWKYCVLGGVLLFTGGYLQAQIPYNGQVLIPPGSTSLALIRGITHPAGMSTGTPDIKELLYTVTTRDIQLPVSLNYIQTSGLKVSDRETEVGMGWYLSAGGRITRMIRQYPDEHRPDRLAYDGMVENEDIYGWDLGNAEYFIDRQLNDAPDLFYFDMGGRTGSFVMDNDNTACIMPYQNLRIEWVDPQSSCYFRITDEKGFVYTFGASCKEQIHSQRYDLYYDDYSEIGEAGGTVRTTWFLEKIESPAGEQITFSYLPCTGSVPTWADLSVLLNEYLYEEKYSIIVAEDEYVPTYCLGGITWNTGKLEFLYGSRNELEEIKIYSLNQEYLKSVKFEYSVQGRLRLDRVVDWTPLQSQSIARFEYYENIDISYWGDPEMFDFDYWGYFNNAGNWVFYPTFWYYGSEISGSNRLPDLEATRNWILKTRYNTSGGYEEYEYELNEVISDWWEEDERFGYMNERGGLRLTSLCRYPGRHKMQCSYSGYYQPLGTVRQVCTNSGIELPYMSIFLFQVRVNNLYELFHINGSPVYYENVTLRHPNGSREDWRYAYHEEEKIPVRQLDDYELLYAENAYHPFVPQYWKKKQLISETSYNAAGKQVAQTRYFYRPYTEVKKRVVDISLFRVIENGQCHFEYSGSIDIEYAPIFVSISYHDSEPLLLDSIVREGDDIVRTVTSYTYDRENFLPVEIQTRDAAGDRYTTSFRYPFHYPVNGASSTSEAAHALKVMQEKNMLAIPVETVVRKNNQVAEGIISEYKVIPTQNVEQAIALSGKKQLHVSTPTSSYQSYGFNSSYEAISDSRYRYTEFADRYDMHGNIIQTHSLYGNPISLIYGYNNSLLIATVEDAETCTPAEGRQGQVIYESFEEHPAAVSCTAKTGRKAFSGAYQLDFSNLKYGEYLLSYWRSEDGGATWEQRRETVEVKDFQNSYYIGGYNEYVDEVIVAPEEARVSTCSYIPGWGKLSESDANGLTTYYEYDHFGRLIRISDTKRRPLKSYEYSPGR